MRRGYRRPPFWTIGVWCSWLHSAHCKLSIKALVSAFFVCVWILHVSADICMFLMFAANSLRVGRRWQSANIIAKNASEMHQQLCNNPSKAMQNQFKIDQNCAKERSESDLGSKSVPGFQKSGHGFEKWTKWFAYFCSYLKGFLMFSVISFRARWLWHSANAAASK